MATGKADRRYAKALFSLSEEQGVLVQIHEDLSALARLIDESQDLATFLEHPLIPQAQRKQALLALLDGQANALTLRFLEFLDGQKRLGHLRGICKAMEELYNEHAGIVDVRITSAEPLTDTQVDNIKTKLASKLGKTIQAATDTDQDLIGGFRVQVGDSILDLSLAAKLNTFKREIINA